MLPSSCGFHDLDERRRDAINGTGKKRSTRVALMISIGTRRPDRPEIWRKNHLDLYGFQRLEHLYWYKSQTFLNRTICQPASYPGVSALPIHLYACDQRDMLHCPFRLINRHVVALRELVYRCILELPGGHMVLKQQINLPKGSILSFR